MSLEFEYEANFYMQKRDEKCKYQISANILQEICNSEDANVANIQSLGFETLLDCIYYLEKIQYFGTQISQLLWIKDPLEGSECLYFE